MKDGVNSANRYYLNRFRDAYRQAVIGKEKTGCMLELLAVPMWSQNCSVIYSSQSCRLNDGLASDGGPLLNLQ